MQNRSDVTGIDLGTFDARIGDKFQHTATKADVEFTGLRYADNGERQLELEITIHHSTQPDEELTIEFPEFSITRLQEFLDIQLD